MNENLIKELINEIKVQNKLTTLFYTHYATNWDCCDNPMKLLKKENPIANQLLLEIKSNL